MAHTNTKKKADPAAADPDLITLDDVADEGERVGEEDAEDCEDGTCGLDDDEPDQADKAEQPHRRQRVSSSPTSDGAKLAAFRAGQAAYAAGVPAEKPTELHAELCNHWQRGWRCAATEAAQGRGVVIATIYNLAERDILVLHRTYMV